MSERFLPTEDPVLESSYSGPSLEMLKMFVGYWNGYLKLAQAVKERRCSTGCEVSLQNWSRRSMALKH